MGLLKIIITLTKGLTMKKTFTLIVFSINLLLFSNAFSTNSYFMNQPIDSDTVEIFHKTTAEIMERNSSRVISDLIEKMNEDYKEQKENIVTLLRDKLCETQRQLVEEPEWGMENYVHVLEELRENYGLISSKTGLYLKKEPKTDIDSILHNCKMNTKRNAKLLSQYMTKESLENYRARNEAASKERTRKSVSNWLKELKSIRALCRLSDEQLYQRFLQGETDLFSEIGDQDIPLMKELGKLLKKKQNKNTKKRIFNTYAQCQSLSNFQNIFQYLKEQSVRHSFLKSALEWADDEGRTHQDFMASLQHLNKNSKVKKYILENFRIFSRYTVKTNLKLLRNAFKEAIPVYTAYVHPEFLEQDL